MYAKQLSTYAIEFSEPAEWEGALSRLPVRAPQGLNRSTVGFMPTEAGRYADTEGRFTAVRAVLIERHLPPDAIQREVRERLGSLEDAEKVKAKWVEVEGELLPHAPLRDREIIGIFDRTSGFMFCLAAPRMAADHLLGKMREALGAMQATPVVLKSPPDALLRRWLTRELALPAGIELGRDLELIAPEGEEGKTSFKGQDLHSPQVRALLEEGAIVSQVALTWRGLLDFVVNARGELKRIAPPGCKLKPAHVFNVWPEIMARLPLFHAEVTAALGGLAGAERRIQIRDEPAKVAVVAVGDASHASTIEALLDDLHERRGLAGITVPQLGNDAMRACFRWARKRGLEVQTVPVTAAGAARNWAAELLGGRPKALLVYGHAAEIEAAAMAAARDRIPIQRLDRNR